MNLDCSNKYRLKNGLELEFIDQSKKIAGDRFYLCVLVRVVVPVKRKWFYDAELNKINFDEVVSFLGKQVLFEQKKEKYFIEASLKKKFIKSIITDTLNLSVKYFEHPNFPKKLILKRFDEKV